MKGCDGTAADYKRHKRRGEEACEASRIAWATAFRRKRRTGTWISKVRGYPEDQDLYRGKTDIKNWRRSNDDSQD